MADTGLSEIILPLTQTELFHKSLEIQQSGSGYSLVNVHTNNLKDLLASYEPNAQISAIEEMIAQGAPLNVVVRLLCLASITTGAIKTKTLDNIKREILQVSGPWCILNDTFMDSADGRCIGIWL